MNIYEKGYRQDLLESKSYWLSPSEVYGKFKTKKILEKMFIEEVKKRKGKIKVLDVGSGYGTDVFMLNMSINKKQVEFHGIDISPTAIKIANKLAKLRGDFNCKFFIGNAENLKLKYKYNIIFSSETIEHLKSPYKALVGMKNLLASNGRIIITTPNRENLLKKISPKFIIRDIDKKVTWHFDRHGKLALKYNPNKPIESVIGHISVMNLSELKNVIRKAGLKIEEIKRGTIVYGGKWYDDHPIIYFSMCILDKILDHLPIYTLTWDFIIKLKK